MAPNVLMGKPTEGKIVMGMEHRSDVCCKSRASHLARCKLVPGGVFSDNYFHELIE